MSVISGWPCHPLMHLNCLFFINVNKMYSTNLFRDSITSENCLQNIVKFWRRADNYHDIYSISIACLLQSILSRFRKGVRRYEKTISIFKKKISLSFYGNISTFFMPKYSEIHITISSILNFWSLKMTTLVSQIKITKIYIHFSSTYSYSYIYIYIAIIVCKLIHTYICLRLREPNPQNYRSIFTYNTFPHMKYLIGKLIPTLIKCIMTN